MQKYILLIRGLPGSGKTSLSDIIMGRDPQAVTCSADDYFINTAGEYVFDRHALVEAHKACQARAGVAISLDKNVIVHNTFTERWELEPYFQMAFWGESSQEAHKVIVVSTFDGGCDDAALAERNSHGVPVESIAAMRERWQEDWGSDDPRPPWER